MAKLRQLIKTMASELGEPEAMVNVRAMHLRKAGLIRSAGRGLNAAEMSAADAAALLVSCMAGGIATQTSHVTSLLLDAEPDVVLKNTKELSTSELGKRLRDGATFGETICEIIDHAASASDFGAYYLLASITSNARTGMYCAIETGVYYLQDEVVLRAADSMMPFITMMSKVNFFPSEYLTTYKPKYVVQRRADYEKSKRDKRWRNIILDVGRHSKTVVVSVGSDTFEGIGIELSGEFNQMEKRKGKIAPPEEPDERKA